MMQYQAEPLTTKIVTQFGESPCWDADRQTLWWVDVRERRLNGWRPADGVAQQCPLPETPGMVTLSDDGGLILAVKDVIYLCDAHGTMTPLDRQHFPDARYNDGKCDPAGRLWVGSMRDDYGYHGAFLFCLETGNPLRRVLDQVSISNGLAWNAAHTVMYFIDSADRNISAFRYCRDTGAIAARRSIFTAGEQMGMPDGMTIDRDDTLWVAQFGYQLDREQAGRVLHIDPANGAILDEVVVPGARYVTSCTFGGKDLSVLYITTAIDYMLGNTAPCPNAGRLFQVKLPVPGLPAVPFAR